MSFAFRKIHALDATISYDINWLNPNKELIKLLWRSLKWQYKIWISFHFGEFQKGITTFEFLFDVTISLKKHIFKKKTTNSIYNKSNLLFNFDLMCTKQNLVTEHIQSNFQKTATCCYRLREIFFKEMSECRLSKLAVSTDAMETVCSLQSKNVHFLNNYVFAPIDSV